jgi:thioredoxin reductase (NADPH)
MGLIETSRHQMFPVLDGAQIETARRFASGGLRRFAPGDVGGDVLAISAGPAAAAESLGAPIELSDAP